MSEQPLPRVGIIGAGGIGATHLRAWAAHGVTPAAIAEARPETLAKAVAEHGGEPFADASDLIAGGLVDVVSICTPPAFHAEIAIAALEAGIGVLCEKPLATSVEEAERVADVAEHTGLPFAMGFCHRLQPQVEAIKAAIERGEIGVVREFRNRFAGHLANVEGTWFANPGIAGGGVLVDTCVHSVDLFRFLIGEAETVHALTSTCASDLGPALEVEDTGVIILKSPEGVLGVIEASWRTPPGEWVLAVHGTGGSLVLDYATLTLRQADASGAWREIAVPEGNRFEREIGAFIATWRGEAEPVASVHDGVAATRILAQAYASAGLSPSGATYVVARAFERGLGNRE